MKPGHSHNTPRTKRLKTEAVQRQQTPAEIQNSRKAAAAQLEFVAVERVLFLVF